MGQAAGETFFSPPPSLALYLSVVATYSVPGVHCSFELMELTLYRTAACLSDCLHATSHCLQNFTHLFKHLLTQQVFTEHLFHTLE